MGTQRIRAATQWDRELPAVVLEYIAALPRGQDQTKRALAHWNVWLQQRHLGSLAIAHGYDDWQKFLIDHTVIYAINDRGDYGLSEMDEETLCEKGLKSRGPLSFNEVKQLIRCLIRWQAHRQWNSAEDLRGLARLYRRFRANAQNSVLQLNGLPESDFDTSAMLIAGGRASMGSRDAALIALTRLLNCSLDDLAQMKCCDLETDDWQNWSVRLPTRPQSMRIYLDPNTTYYLVFWLFERKWRPGLETPLFTGDHNAEPLPPPHIQLIFERRYRTMQVLSHPAPHARDREVLIDDFESDASSPRLLSFVTMCLIESIKYAERLEEIRLQAEVQAAERRRLSAKNAIKLRREAKARTDKAIAELFYKPKQSVKEDALPTPIRKKPTTPTLTRSPSRAETDDEEQYDWDAAVKRRAELDQCSELATGAIEQVDWDAAVRKSR